VGHAPRGAVIGGASTQLIQPFKNVDLSRNLDQNMPKNAYFLKKNCKIAAASGARPPLTSGDWELRSQIPALLLSPIAVVFVECVSSIERTLLRKTTEVTHPKCFGFVFSALSCLCFTSNSAIFVGGAQKYFCRGAPGP